MSSAPAKRWSTASPTSLGLGNRRAEMTLFEDSFLMLRIAKCILVFGLLSFAAGCQYDGSFMQMDSNSGIPFLGLQLAVDSGMRPPSQDKQTRMKESSLIDLQVRPESQMPINRGAIERDRIEPSGTVRVMTRSESNGDSRTSELLRGLTLHLKPSSSGGSSATELVDLRRAAF